MIKRIIFQRDKDDISVQIDDVVLSADEFEEIGKEDQDKTFAFFEIIERMYNSKVSQLKTKKETR